MPRPLQISSAGWLVTLAAVNRFGFCQNVRLRCVSRRGASPYDNQYIDYWMGHGAMLLGHAHSAVVEAVREQMARSTHAGGSTRFEIDWA